MSQKSIKKEWNKLKTIMEKVKDKISYNPKQPKSTIAHHV